MQSNEQLSVLAIKLPGPSAHDNILTAASRRGMLMAGSIFEFVGLFAMGIIIKLFIVATAYGLTVVRVTSATLLAILARLELSEGIVRFPPVSILENHQYADL